MKSNVIDYGSHECKHLMFIDSEAFCDQNFTWQLSLDSNSNLINIIPILQTMDYLNMRTVHHSLMSGIGFRLKVFGKVHA